MALVKTSPIISDIRGTVGGVCFSRSRHGVTIRRAITPTKGQSNAQSLSRTAYSQAVDFWRNGLTEANRIAWIDAAKTITFRNRLGDPTQPTGFQLYLRSALASLHSAFTFPFLPPDPLLAPFPEHVISWHEGTDRVMFSSPTNQDPPQFGLVNYWSSPDFSPSIYSPRGPWTFAGTISYQDNDPFDEPLLPIAIRMRPCRRFYRMRSWSLSANFSSLITLSILIPEAP